MAINLGQICRLCMEYERNMIPLFVDEEKIAEKVMEFIPMLELTAGDGLPEQVCSQCVVQVNAFFKFKRQCENANTVLRKLHTQAVQIESQKAQNVVYIKQEDTKEEYNNPDDSQDQIEIDERNQTKLENGGNSQESSSAPYTKCLQVMMEQIKTEPEEFVEMRAEVCIDKNMEIGVKNEVEPYHFVECLVEKKPQQAVNASFHGKIMIQMARESLLEMNEPSHENISDLENESARKVTPFPESLQECGNNASLRQPSDTATGYQSGSSSSSSCSTCSCSNSSSSSEHYDDVVNDKTCVPGSDSGSENSKENSDTQNHDADIYGKAESTVLLVSPPENNTLNISTISSCSTSILLNPHKKGIKRKRNTEQWKRNILKKARNSGKAYETQKASKKTRKERKMKPSCGEKCKLQCSTKFSDGERKQLFSAFWNMADIEKQRRFILNSMQMIQPKYRYTRVGGTRRQRQYNNAFYFQRNNQKVRVCKLFFKNTLDINDRPIRTVLEKKNKVAGLLLEPDLRENRGKYKSMGHIIKERVDQHIDSISKIASH